MQTYLFNLIILEINFGLKPYYCSFPFNNYGDVGFYFFTKEKQQINVQNNNFGSFGYGWGYGWGFGRGPFFGAQYNISNSTQGTLYIDLIDAKQKELIWQGIGRGNLTTSVKYKDERINSFVNSILCSYPPEMNN